MGELVRSYGKGLTTIFVGFVALWILLMIVVPQITMIDRAFTYEDRGGETAMLAIEINRAYTKRFQLEQQVQQAENAADADTGLSAPSVSAPSVGAPSATTPSAGGLPQPSAGGVANGQADVEALEAEIAELTAKIEELEALEEQSTGEAGVQAEYSLRNFTTMSGIHFQIFVMTLVYAFCVTILSFLICYPVAFVIATTTNRNRLALMMLGLVIPYAINELLRIFSWIMILEKNGILNSFLSFIGIIDIDAGEGIRFVASNGAVFTVMVYAYVLFMVFPIYNTIDTLDKNQIEAARDLGASAWKIHTRVVIPHAKPGIAVGSIMTFMLSAGSIAVPEIVGRGLHPDWFSQLIYRRFFEADAWNQGSAYSLALLVACIAFIFATMALFKVGVRDIAK